MSTLQNQPLVQAVPGPAPNDSPVARAPFREQFIPLRAAELVETLAASSELSANQASSFRDLCQRLQALLHCDYHRALGALKNAYAPFDPDSDTKRGADPSDERLSEQRHLLFEKFAWLLARGNFIRVAQEDIDRAVEDCSHWGIKLAVDFNAFDRLDIYYRGDVIGTRFRRLLRKRFRTEAVRVPIYQRLVVIFRLRPGRTVSKLLGTDDVYIKLFKDIPKLDLDMLLPGTQVKMSLVDRARIMLPTLSGLSIAIWKMVQGAFLVAAVGFYGSLALVGGTVGYGVRSFYGYLNTKQKYQLNLTQSLYYQNLDNNAGVIHRLLDEAEEQEGREAILAYFYLWRHAPAEGWTEQQIDERIESFLRAEVGGDVDFEIDDALAKLQRLKIVESCDGGRWKAVSIDEALDVLARRWQAWPD